MNKLELFLDINIIVHILTQSFGYNILRSSNNIIVFIIIFASIYK